MVHKLALRNLARNRWRSALTMGGIAVAIALLTWMIGYMNAFLGLMVQGAIATETGSIQIQSEAFVDEPAIFNSIADAPEFLASIESLDGVDGVASRVEGFGLLGDERSSQVTRIVGVEPEREQGVTRIARGLDSGEWLASAPAPPGPRQLVLGSILARQLDVEVGDELALFLTGADGSLGNESLVVTGIVTTGTGAIDRLAAFMHIDDARFLMALEGRSHSIAIKADDDADLDALRDAIAARVPERLAARPGRKADERAPPEVTVRTWRQVLPQMASMIETSKSSMWLFYIVIYALAALGILNTQRMSALEREREFGVLLAIGMAPRLLFAIVVVETLAVTMAGGLLGALLGTGVNAIFQVVGLDLAMFGGSGGSYMGVSFEDRLYFRVTVETVATPLAGIAVVALLCGLWPALRAARLDPIRAISGRR